MWVSLESLFTLTPLYAGQDCYVTFGAYEQDNDLTNGA